MIGNYPAKLDEKNRLFVPAKLRSELGSTFYATIGFSAGHKCLNIYTEQQWQGMVERFNSLSIAEKSGPASVIFMCAVECTPDKQFRFSLSQTLLNYAGLAKEVVIVGCAGQAEIWDAEQYAAFEAEAMAPEKLMASLEAIGL